MKFSDKLTELQKLSHRLLDVNCASTTEYLECTMRELQEQWDMFEEKYINHFVCAYIPIMLSYIHIHTYMHARMYIHVVHMYSIALKYHAVSQNS